MKKVQIVLVLGLLTVCIAFVALMFSPGAISYAQNNANTAPMNTPTADPHTFGLPAIKPHLNAGPSFTHDDVGNYVNTHQIPGASLMGSKPIITKILFESSLEVSKQLKGESTGFPDDAILCYVEFQGTFSFAGPSGKAVTYQTGYEVFDSQTGNLVMSGGM